jgi:hypothetical protein
MEKKLMSQNMKKDSLENNVYLYTFLGFSLQQPVQTVSILVGSSHEEFYIAYHGQNPRSQFKGVFYENIWEKKTTR